MLEKCSGREECPNPAGDKCRLDSEIIKSDRLGHSSPRIEGCGVIDT